MTSEMLQAVPCVYAPCRKSWCIESPGCRKRCFSCSDVSHTLGKLYPLCCTKKPIWDPLGAHKMGSFDALCSQGITAWVLPNRTGVLRFPLPVHRPLLRRAPSLATSDVRFSGRAHRQYAVSPARLAQLPTHDTS